MKLSSKKSGSVLILCLTLVFISGCGKKEESGNSDFGVTSETSFETDLQESSIEITPQDSSVENLVSDAEKTEDDNWIVTQYSDNSGNQGMFYTISNEYRKQLIVIDGGWEANAEQVYDVIVSKGGHINAWILTHYHEDHIGAFNSIMEDPYGITVDAIYDSPMDYEEYLAVAQEWDTPESYERYREITSGLDNVIHLAKDDVIVFDDLSITVFNAYDNDTKAYSDIPNNTSLVFKVQGPEKSMLFCADVHSTDMEVLLYTTYGDALDCDYLQAGHHGNNSMDDAFYDAVSPEYIFFDAPQWLMEGENYKTGNLIRYCENRGIPYLWYNLAPNELEL